MPPADRNHLSRWRPPFALCLCIAIAGCGANSSDSHTRAAIQAAAQGEAAPPKLHPIVIRPAPLPKSIAAKIDQSNSTTIGCATCHTTRPANKQNRSTEDLDQFHQGLKLNHGKLACIACHDAPGGYAALHLADGSTVAFADTMQLCAQCHGTQFRDYQHGSHGGMNGYWDRTRGPRERNQCLHCHDPHSPQIAVVQPVPGPRDRFPPVKHEATHE